LNFIQSKHKQTDRQTDKQTNHPTNKQKTNENKQTDTETNKQAIKNKQNIALITLQFVQCCFSCEIQCGVPLLSIDFSYNIM